MSYPSLKERLASLATNAAVAYVVFVVASGQLLPTGGLETVWLICAASYWFLNLLSAPWFIPPRDAIISAVGAILVLTTMDLSSVSTFARELNHVRWGAVIFSGVVIFFAVAAVTFHEREKRSPFGHLSYQISNIFGRGEILFSAPAVVGIIAHYQSSFEKMSWLILFWILLSIGKPVEHLFSAVRQFFEERNAKESSQSVGQIARVDHPDIIRVRLTSTGSWKPNKLFTASLPDGTQRYVLSLFATNAGRRSGRNWSVCRDPK